MINAIPILGWLLSFIGAIGLSIPFWLCWSVCGLGETYFGFLPAQWHYLPFWHCVGLSIIISIVKALVPKVISASSESKTA